MQKLNSQAYYITTGDEFIFVVLMEIELLILFVVLIIIICTNITTGDGSVPQQECCRAVCAAKQH